MIEASGLLGHGFSDCLTLMDTFCAVVGCLLGSLTGVLPGLGISETMATLLPVAFDMQPLSTLITISGIYFGSQYGGTITSILASTPGEATNIVTRFDGYLPAKQGKGEKALSVTAISSFCDGTVSLIGLTLAASALARVALSFGKVEFSVIMVFGLVLLTIISGKNQLKGLIAVRLGVILSCVGLDDLYGTLRFTYNTVDLCKGISFATFTMDVYEVTKLMSAICILRDQGGVADFSLREQFPNKKDFGQIYKTIGRCDITGFGAGLVSGVGSMLAIPFIYGTERSLSKYPDIFGTGLLEGVAAPEAANNAAMYAGMVPPLSLDIPSISSMMPLMGTFITRGIASDLMLISEYSGLFWGLVASMFIGNIVLLIINPLLVGVQTGLLKMDFTILVPPITFITSTDGYAINNSMFDMGVMVICGIFGFFLSACGYDTTALVVGLFLGPTPENSSLGIMALHKGSLLVTPMGRPIAAAILSIAMITLVRPTAKSLIQFFGKQKAANQEEVQNL